MINGFIAELLGYLVDFTQYSQKLMGDVGLSRLNYGWLVILFFAFVVFLIGLNLGRSRILISLFCLYVAAFLESHFIYFGKLQKLAGIKSDLWVHIGLFFIIFGVSLVIFNRSTLKQSLTLKETSFFPIAFIAALEIGFLASLIIAYLSPEISGNLPAGIIKFFGTKNAQFWWAAAPLIILIFLKRRKEGPKINP